MNRSCSAADGRTAQILTENFTWRGDAFYEGIDDNVSTGSVTSKRQKAPSNVCASAQNYAMKKDIDATRTQMLLPSISQTGIDLAEQEIRQLRRCSQPTTAKSNASYITRNKRIQEECRISGVAAARAWALKVSTPLQKRRWLFRDAAVIISPEAMQQSIREIQEYTNNYVTSSTTLMLVMVVKKSSPRSSR